MSLEDDKRLKKAHIVEIMLLDQKITLRSLGQNPQEVEKVVSFATEKLKDIESKHQSILPHQAALLAFLDLAEEYLKAKQKVAQWQGELLEAVEKVITKSGGNRQIER